MSSFFLIIPKLHVRGMALYPFILFRERKFLDDPVMMNHERIHHRQQTELLLLPFYVLYVGNYLVNRIKYASHDEAYRNIVFEREAYAREADTAYLDRRRLFSFLHYW